MHLKRNETPKSWPLKRKGTKYVARPLCNLRKAVPLLLILRDILKIAESRREVKKILNSKYVKVNGKIVIEDKYPIILFDITSFGDKNFRLIAKNKKFCMEEVDEKDSKKKTAKVIGKKLVKKGRIQVNLSDGRNYLLKEKIKVGDSVVINLKENKIDEILPFKKGCKALFISGKRSGTEAEFVSAENNKAKLKISDREINADLKNLMVIK